MSLSSETGVRKVLRQRLFDSDFFNPNLTSSSSSIKFHVDKPIVRTPRPQEFNQWLGQYVPPKRPKKKSLDLVSSLATYGKWTSTSEFAVRESALPIQKEFPVPVTTREELADPVRSAKKPPLNEKSPMLWQEIGRRWDYVQCREPMKHHSTKGAKPRKTEYPTANDLIKENALSKNTQSEMPAIPPLFLKPIPDYKGYIPRHPVPFRDESDYICSTSRQSYRRIPSYEYKRLVHCHNGPLSKTIVLTSPHNPFKNLTHQANFA